jgi:glyoxylase-like metal-dependent hydrolase (beta-lactamase superfamily II)
MIFRQLFETESCTYTYLFGCPQTRQAVLLDPVLEAVDRDLCVLNELGLRLAYTLETHVHADHLTSAGRLKKLTGSKIAYPTMDHLACADIGVAEGSPLAVGSIFLKPLFTPGHTDHHHAYWVDLGAVGAVFTGDALLIDGCGRTDFQSGSAESLYDSVTEKLFTLPDETLVYPAHDYNNRRVSSIGQEKVRNPRLGAGKTLEEFMSIMNNLKLAYPKKIDIAVPGNRVCGDYRDGVPEPMRQIQERAVQG